MENIQFSDIKAIICDLDGTLLDSESTYYRAYEKVVLSQSKSYSVDIHRQIVGTPYDWGINHVIQTCQLGITEEQFRNNAKEILNTEFLLVKPFNGVLEFIKELKNRNFKLAIATSSAKASFDKKMKNNQDLLELFDVVVCGDDPDVKNGKPAPDIFLTAAKRIDILPENCIVFEDSPSGVSGGKAANMKVVAVPFWEWNFPNDVFKEADILLKNIVEFNLNWLQIPV